MLNQRSVTCTLVNESEADIIATGASVNHKIEQGELLGSMPAPVAPAASGSWKLVQSVASTTGPAGWACYERAGEVVYQLRFGNPALGRDAFSVVFNYLERTGTAAYEIKFANAAGPIPDDKIASELDLRVEYRLRWQPAASPGVPPGLSGPSAQSVGAQPNGVSSITTPPFIARWNQPNITEARKKVLAAVASVYPILWAKDAGAAQIAAAKNGGGTYTRKGEWTDKGSTSCTSSCPWIGENVSPATSNKWSFNAPNVGRGAWVRWGTGAQMPSVGDVYVLWCDEYERPYPPRPKQARIVQPAPPAARIKDSLWDAWDQTVAKMNPHMRHVGVIVQVPTTDSECFITADGGQSFDGKQAAHLVKRSFSRRTPGPTSASFQEQWDKSFVGKAPYGPPANVECLYFSGEAEKGPGNRLLGWIDVDVLAQQKLVLPYDPVTDDPLYAELGARIARIP